VGTYRNCFIELSFCSMSQEKIVRDKLISRVRALLSMTIENGCSEAEAMSAAAMASKLMEEHDLAIKDIDALKSEPVGSTGAGYGKTAQSRELHPAAKFASVAVANFFDCRVWYNGTQIFFFGMKDDVALAHDLLQLVRGAMDQEIARFKRTALKTDGLGVHAQTTSFAEGMAARVSERLKFVKELRSKNVRATGNDIVVIKSELVTEAYAKAHGRESNRKGQFGSKRLSSAAYAAGYLAGDRVGLGQSEIAKPSFDARTPGQRFQDSFNEARAALVAELEAHFVAAKGSALQAKAARIQAEEEDWNPKNTDDRQGTQSNTEGQQTRTQTWPKRLWAELAEWSNFAFINIVYGSLLFGIIISYIGTVPFAPDIIVVQNYGHSLEAIIAAISAAVLWACLATIFRTMRR
jgi:hypothetical protein